MMVCTQCGFQNETQDAFCGSCGAFLEWAGEKVEESPSPRDTTTETVADPAREPEAVTATLAEPSTQAEAEGRPAPEHAGAEAVVDIRMEEEPGAEVKADSDRGEEAEPEHKEKVAADTRVRGAASVTEAPVSAGTKAQAPPVRPPAQVPPSRPGGSPGPVARRPDAVKPMGPKTRPVPAKPPPRREVRPGDLICNQCEEGNDPDRRFCRRCGGSLVEAKAAVAPPPLPWWKRLFVRQPKVVAAGERPMRRGGSVAQRTLRSRLYQMRRVVALVAILGLGVGYLGPWRSTVNTKIRSGFRGIREVVAPRYNEISPDSLEGTTSSLPDHPPEHAVDDIIQTYWAENAEGDGTGQRFVVSFDSPVDFGKIGFRLGASTKPEDFATQPRPEKVRLHFSDGTAEVATKDLTLKNTADFQEHDARAKDTVRLEIEILSTNRSLQGGTACSIAEIEFWERT